MTDPWAEIARELGPAAGREFLRRLRATVNGEVSLHVSRRRGQTIGKWVAPPEPIDDGAQTSAQSDPT